MSIVPVSEIALRMPSQGRIRTGVKGPKGEPRALDTFRLSSNDREAIEQIASLYGGTPKAWPQAPTADQWQVTTTAKELPIALPPDPLGGTPCYELWSRGGLQRRCDGVTCALPEATDDGATIGEQPCICVRNDALECKPIVRLAVILREVRFGGTWMIECKGWNGFHELPGMVDIIQSVQDRGIVRAVLALEKRQTKVMGRTKNFVVPTLRLADSADALARVDSALRSLGVAPVAQMTEMLGVGERLQDMERVQAMSVVDPGWDDGEPVDAEIVFEPLAEDWAAVDSAVRGICAKTWGFDEEDANAEWLLTKLQLVASERQWTDNLEAIMEDWWQNLRTILSRIEAGELEVVRTDDAKLTLQVPTSASST
jgi:hypothetical protein